MGSRMKKYILLLLIPLLLLSACRASAADTDCATLGARIASNLSQSEELKPVDEDFLESVFDFTAKTEQRVLLLDSTDAATREIGIFRATDTVGCADIEKNIRAYLKNEQDSLISLQTLYPSNDLDERLWRYQNATVLTKGNTVAYFVLSDEEAKIAKNAFLTAFE